MRSQLRRSNKNDPPFVGDLEFALDLVCSFTHPVHETSTYCLRDALPKELDLAIGFLLKLLLHGK